MKHQQQFKQFSILSFSISDVTLKIKLLQTALGVVSKNFMEEERIYKRLYFRGKTFHCAQLLFMKMKFEVFKFYF